MPLRNAGVMEKFGPNPTLMMESLSREWSHKITHQSNFSHKDKQTILKGFDTTDGSTLSNALKGVTGLNDVAGNSFQAQLWASTRGVISMAKLGGATVTASAK